MPSRQGELDADAARRRRDALRRDDRGGARVDAARVDWRALGGELAAVDARDWRLCLPAEPGPPRDLFIEAPDGWWFATKAEPEPSGRDCFAIALREKPKDGALPVNVRATITGGAGALDVALILPPKS